jgi:cytochrome c biogenesis protein CcmG, thiol:disulfide interchange protein DsbE
MERRPTGETAAPALPIAITLMVAAVLAVLAYGVTSSGRSETIDDALAAGQRVPAPEVALPPLEGGATASLARYRGKVVVLNFWASWCAPCREESPLLQRWHDRIRTRGGTVLGVNVLDVTSDAREFVRDYGLTYPMLRDGSGDSGQRYGVAGYPETFVIDRRGRIVAITRGPVDDADLRRQLIPLLQKRS